MLNRHKAGSLSLPFTSTPANKVCTANNLNVPSMEKPASPWRLQDELILPRTSYAHRTKEMLPSYESFANNPAETPGTVTERRKSSSDGTVIDPLPAAASEPSEGMITDKELREIERMYVELKATSEMSEKLIRAMRQSKQKAATPQQDQTMRQACLKLKQWYDRSMSAFNRSMRILGNVQRIPGCEFNNRPTAGSACPSPLSHEQQRTLNDFNSSTDRFRSMLAQLQSTINDSDVENRPPPTPASEKESAALGKSVPANKQIHILEDILILPDRSDAAKRNPLMPLNVVPLPQRDSPLMSPLAKTPTNPGPTTNITRRELQYDKENELSMTDNENQPKGADNVPPTIVTTAQLQLP
uniref:Uncharacterized protein n=1 Tax=Anopheles maculatus TaxID=74869 RepID=A0A182TC72_9DIPT